MPRSYKQRGTGAVRATGCNQGATSCNTSDGFVDTTENGMKFEPLRGTASAPPGADREGRTMSKIHWSVIPSLLAAGWLLLAGATVVTIAGVPTESFEQATTTAAQHSPPEDLPAILVVASR